MAFDPKVNRNEKDAIGDPGDAIATNTTEAWTSISLLKAIFSKLGGGTGAAISSDVAQGSTTAGQTGGLTQAAVTTGAPSYTTGKTNPLSLKTNGDLRVADTDAAALLTTIDSKLGDLKGYTDGLEALIGTTNTNLTTLQTYTDSLESYTGALTETAPATDTASSGLNGRLQRVAQRLTSLIALLPAALGQTTKTGSLSVALASNDDSLALIGGVTETVPASDTASSGLNGRLQRIAQRVTSLIALVPTSLGQKAMASSLAVTVASDQSAIPVSLASVPSHAVTNAGTFAVQAASTVADGSNVVEGAVADAAVTAGAAGSISAKLRSISRDLVANIVLAAGTNLIGRAVADASAATGGIVSTSRIVSAAASTNATSAKGSAGRLYAVQGYNASSAVRYLKLYNKASAPTVGTDTPIKTMALPPSAGFAFDWPVGYSFATGIAYALTTGSADADTGALTAADVLGLNIDYV